MEQMLASTRKGVKRISGIVQNLRGFARLDQAAVDRVDLQQAISSSLELIRGQLEQRQITVKLQEGGAIPVICAPAQINQVILNLLVNAMQAIEATGRSTGRIKVATPARGNEVILEVADDGCGIPAEILPRIFDPFFTTKPVGQGTGLGLAISHGIITDHGGRIEVESRPAEGAASVCSYQSMGKDRTVERPADPCPLLKPAARSAPSDASRRSLWRGPICKLFKWGLYKFPGIRSRRAGETDG